MTTSGQWEALLGSWAAYMRVMAYSEGTIGVRQYWIRRLARNFPAGPDSVTFDELVVWLAAHEWKPTTRRVCNTSIRQFWAWMIETERTTSSPAAKLPRVKMPRPKPRPAPESDFHLALSISDRRARLAIMLAGYCGMRRFEIAKARREDMVEDLIGYSLRIVGKGSHERIVPLPDEIVAEIKRVESGWLFPSTRASDGGRPISPWWLGKIVTRNLPGDLTTHTLRHRFGSVAYNRTKDLRAVQELLGHAKPETTAIYTEVSPQTLRDVMQAAVA